MPITYLDEDSQGTGKITYLDNPPEPKVGLFGKVPLSKYQQGERNIVGDIFERPGAAVRGLFMGKGYRAGAINPSKVPTFQDASLDKFHRGVGDIARKVDNPIAKGAIEAAGTLGGFGISAAGMVGDIATNPADILTSVLPKAPGVSNLLRAASKTPLAQAGKELANIPVSRIPATLDRMVTKTPEAVMKNIEKGIKSTVGVGIDKGIKPTVVGKKTIAKNNAFRSKVQDAVVDIVENKDSLQFADEAGDVISKLPESNAEWAQAIGQRKRAVYSEYSKLAQQAGDQGAVYDVNPIVKSLKEVANSKKYGPETRQYALKQIDNLSELQGATPDIVDARIAEINGKLEGYYKGMVSKPEADVLASLAKQMRSQLDESIEKTTGKPFQALKNKYGALKAAEKEINHRAIVTARANPKGLADLTDVFSGGQITRGAVGLITGNPYAAADIASGVSMNLVKRAYKSINNPDRAVAKMFKKTEQLLNQAGKIKGQLPRSVNAELVQRMPVNNQAGIPFAGTKQITFNPAVNPAKLKELPSSKTFYGQGFTARKPTFADYINMAKAKKNIKSKMLPKEAGEEILRGAWKR